jgi:hypothetical protein
MVHHIDSRSAGRALVARRTALARVLRSTFLEPATQRSKSIEQDGIRQAIANGEPTAQVAFIRTS